MSVRSRLRRLENAASRTTSMGAGAVTVVGLSGSGTSGEIPFFSGGTQLEGDEGFTWEQGDETTDTGFLRIVSEAVTGTLDDKQMRIGYDDTFYTDIMVDATGDMYLRPVGNTVLVQSTTGTGELYVDGTGSTSDSFIYFSYEEANVKWSIYRDGGNNHDLRIDDAMDTRLRIYQTTGNIGFGSSTESMFWDEANLKLKVTRSTATTTPHVELFQASTGDSALRFTETGSHSYIIGVDNSDADKWKVSYGSAGNAVLGTNDYLTIDTTGVTTIGSLALTGFTAGSVLFYGASAISQNNAAFFWDNANTFATITSTAGKQLRLAYDTSLYWDLTAQGASSPHPEMAFLMQPSLSVPANQVFMNFVCTDYTISSNGASIPYGQGTPNFGMVGTSPGYNLQETDGGSDAKTWTHWIDTGVLTYNLLNDANNAATTWFTMTRSGITPVTATYYCKLDVQYATNPQLRLTYTANTTYVDISSDSAGGLIFQPTGTYCGIFKSAVGSTLTYYASNTDNTNAASSSAFVAVVGGGSGGDPHVRYEVTGVTNWIQGIDNSDSDKYKICSGSALGTNDYLTITSAGAVTIANTFNINSAVWLQFSGVNTIFSSAGVGLLLQQPNGSSATIFRDSSGNTQWTVGAGSIGHLTAGSNARFAHGTSALATNATEGFFHIQSCAGAPSGTPATIPTGQIPMVWDSTNLQLYVYTGGAWKKSAVFT